MASLKDQLKQIKLEASTEPVKDYSDPKLAGFISDKEVEDYQSSVLDVNTEHWLDILKEETFPTTYCTISLEEAKLFVAIYKNNFENLDPGEFHSINWRETLSAGDREIIKRLTEQLENAIESFIKDENEGVFVKTSSRSAKDAPLFLAKFKTFYTEEMRKLCLDFNPDPSKVSTIVSFENIQITCLLRACFRAMKVKHASEVIDMFACSERIFQDMLLAVDNSDRFHENFVIRKFVDIDVDMEFRGFVYRNQLTALSQYNYLIYSARLVQMQKELCQKIVMFFKQNVHPKLLNTNFPHNFIIDFAVCDNGNKIWIIEINPFLSTTDGALFSWSHEGHLLEGKEGFHFRIVERPKPGAKAMLPGSARLLLENCQNI